MTWLLANLGTVLYGGAIVGGLLWWLRSSKRPKPAPARARTPEEEAELRRLRDALRRLEADSEQVRPG